MERQKIAKKIREARQRCRLSQEEVAKQMGWKSHGSIAAIENGSQDIKTWELLKLAEIFKVPPESLYKDVPEAALRHPTILWRKVGSNLNAVLQEERAILQHCQDYRLVERLTESVTNKKPLPKEQLNLKTADEAWANQLADKLHRELRLGDYPAELLAKCLEEDFGILLLNRPLDNGSAACYREEQNAAIVLNNKEVPWRSVFNLAHELFHLVTWSPSLIEQIQKSPKSFQKNERLADAFAAALLMPQQMVSLDVQGHDLSYAFIIALARKYRVSKQAMLLRLRYLGLLSAKSVELALEDKDFLDLDRATLKKAFESAPPFGQRFLRLAYLAFEKGRLSKNRLAQMLGVHLRDVGDFLAEKGFYLTDDQTIETSLS